MNIAFFDFDGTITKKDTLFDFTKYAVGSFRFYFGFIVLLPSLLLFKLKVIPNYRAKEMFISYFFKGTEEKKFEKIAKEYSLNHIDSFIRKKALLKIEEHKKNGNEVVVVSASMESWLKPWCEKNGLKLISTKLEKKENIITGKFLTKNCHGKEKVNRIRELYNLESFEKVYAYGDSSGDKEMLEIAHESYYKPFRS